MVEETPKILVVDDEKAIIEQLPSFLKRSGFDVKVAMNGVEALEIYKRYQPDLIVLDVVMPQMDGRAVLRNLRQREDWTPVILLTQVGDSTERAMAIEEGADDYLNKPYDPFELIARIRAVLRRAKPGRPPLSASQQLWSNKLVLDRVARRASLSGQEINLTPKSVNVLEYLMIHCDELITRERLLDAVWGWNYPAGIRTVDTRIAEIRRALDDDPNTPEYIETITGKGYRFVGVVSTHA